MQPIKKTLRATKGYDATIDHPDETKPSTIRYRVVKRDGDPEADGAYEATFVEIDNNTFQIDVIEARDLVGRGIGEAILCDLKKSTRKVVRSSSNKPQGTREYRTGEATAMWKSMEARGLAKYEPAEDRFYVNG